MIRSVIKLTGFCLTFILVLASCSGDRSQTSATISLEVQNPAPIDRADETVLFSVDDLKDTAVDFSQPLVVMSAAKELSSQIIRSGGSEKIAICADFAAGEKQSWEIRSAVTAQTRDYPKRTQAELSHKFGGKWEARKYIDGAFRNVEQVRVPDEHTDHSFFFRYEGPGWESDKVGYRFYLDWRNATDIFGKKTSDMVLQDVGQDGFDSYHEMADWGMDILKVGESLGIGSIGMWHDGKVYRVSETDSVRCRIVANGPIYSHIRTRYFGWQVDSGKYNLTSNLSITAGSRMTAHTLSVTGDAINLCTGIVKHENANTFGSELGNGWRYFATYGKQSLAEDKLGMAVLYHKSDLIEVAEDEQSHVIVLRPQQGNLTYYFGAAWEKEPGGIQSDDEFRSYLDEMVTRLNNPVSVSSEAY